MRRTIAAACGLFLLLPVGCAKSPATGITTGPQLTVSMTVRGRIRPDYFYFVLFNNANDTSGASGPIPVVAAPYGNGFASGAFTQFVQIDGTQPGGDGVSSVGYGVYRVIPGSSLRSFAPLATPVQTLTGTNTIQFRIPLAELATGTLTKTSDFTSLQINFIATNTVPTDPNYTGTKLFDALGDSRQPGSINDYISINTAQSAIYQNSDKGLEPSDDVVQSGNGGFAPTDDPDLDITDWRVQISD